MTLAKKASSLRMWGRTLVGARVLLLTAMLVDPSRAPASEPSEAMAFVRVVGDVQVEFTRPWKQAIAEVDVEIATGSGFVIAPGGLIVTSHHVVNGSTATVRVQGEEARVTTRVKRIEVVVGRGEARQIFEPWVAAEDAELDLAVLQVNASELSYIPFGDSDAVEAGGRTTVLGFPFGRRLEVGKRADTSVVPDATVTAGSLSASRADEQGAVRYLQSDATVHPGNSGGPMVDGDGYAVGVVKMKVAQGRSAPGPGFSVPINLVKDFLDGHGLLSQLPTARLQRGVVHGLEWKRFGLELPDGLADSSPARLRLETGDSGGPFAARVERVATPWTFTALEEALLQGDALSGFVPAPAPARRRVEKGKPARVLGTARGTTRDGRPFWLEYAVLDLGPEKVVARYLAPPDDMAFNLSLVRTSLEGLEATRLLTDEVRGAIRVGFEPVPYPSGAGAIPLPAGWVSEPATSASCEQVGDAEGLAASPPGDFTVVFRALRWGGEAGGAEKVIRACGGATGSGYARRFARLGVNVGARGLLVRSGEEMLLLEVEAPEEKLAFVGPLFESWAGQIAEAP